MVTDLRHFEPADPTAELPPRAERLREFLGGLVWAASVRPSGEPSPTALPCRRRPGRRPCRGRIVVFRQDIPPEVEWRCPECDDAGVISGWRGTFWDLGSHPPSPVSAEEDRRLVEVLVTHEEYGLLRDSVTLVDTDAERILAGARPRPGGRVQLEGRLADWEALVDGIAFEANHADDRGLQDRLYDIFDLMSASVDHAIGGG